MRRILLALADVSMASAAAAGSRAHSCAQTERNRAIVTRFADLMYVHENPRAAFEAYVAPAYIQHNPGIADGRDAAVRALVPLFAKPQGSFEIRRILIDGNLAAIHLLSHHVPGDRGTAVVDIYRLRSGRIVEHWDVLQSVPATSANPHPMF